uniref:ATP-binding domain containing protein n=1 Tax=Encephalitozoon cuniculi TaxID=6035 RepID=M1KAF6_ENCCN|nr:ATP-binding domain containing protein [Encephalitozoon cuniculi]
MDKRRKRKAKDQLSPYSNPDEENDRHNTAIEPSPSASRKRAKARVGDLGTIADSGPLKGVLSSVNILKPRIRSDRISGLNRCFVNAVQKVVEKESNKSLLYLFRQYEKYYEELNEASD